MAYVLIEFEDGGGVAVVRKTWITPRKKEVFWPPLKDQKTFDKILETTKYPDTEKWKVYSILKCLYETGEHEIFSHYFLQVRKYSIIYHFSNFTIICVYVNLDFFTKFYDLRYYLILNMLQFFSFQ